MDAFDFANRIAKELMKKNVLGEIEAVNVRFWSGALGDLLNNGIHVFDLAQCFGGKVTSVYALSIERGNPATGSISMMLEFESGAVGSMFFSSTPQWNSLHERTEITGKNGKALVSENGKRLYLYAPDQPAQCWEPPQVLHWVTGHNLAGFTGEFKYFADSIIHDSTGKARVESGLYSIRLKEGVETSLREGICAIFRLHCSLNNTWRYLGGRALGLIRQRILGCVKELF